ncbi:glutathione S-transferase [Pigmentiphaga soli]|uniref:Glutathione S-transferase n=1 Tax=Pigmentiphaga soli TaxID=1007095 RepID=A0ABP8GCD2_9BURK
MKLIGSLSSPFVRKVRIVLAEKKLDYQFEIENVWASDTRIQDANPLGKVPCLVMEDGGAVFDSRVIVEYLDTITPVGRLLPASGRERAEVKCWEALADGLIEAAALIRYELTQRPAALRSEDWIARQRGKIEAAIEAMAAGLGERSFCMGNYSLADIAVGCALGSLDFRFPDIAWREHASLVRLLERLNQRPSFADTAPR